MTELRNLYAPNTDLINAVTMARLTKQAGFKNGLDQVRTEYQNSLKEYYEITKVDVPEPVC